MKLQKVSKKPYPWRSSQKSTIISLARILHKCTCCILTWRAILNLPNTRIKIQWTKWISDKKFLSKFAIHFPSFHMHKYQTRYSQAKDRKYFFHGVVLYFFHGALVYTIEFTCHKYKYKWLVSVSNTSKGFYVLSFENLRIW